MSNEETKGTGLSLCLEVGEKPNAEIVNQNMKVFQDIAFWSRSNTVTADYYSEKEIQLSTDTNVANGCYTVQELKMFLTKVVASHLNRVDITFHEFAKFAPFFKTWNIGVDDLYKSFRSFIKSSITTLSKELKEELGTAVTVTIECYTAIVQENRN